MEQPLSLLPLRRTYRARCSLCYQITFVFNKLRVGGLCLDCREDYTKSWHQYYAVFLISKWWKKMKCKKVHKKMIYLVAMRKLNVGIKSNIPKYMWSFLE